jgi:DNA-binding HxlR family transcriptional regulator
MLLKETIKQKPLHIEYSLTDKGREMINIYKLAARISGYERA